MPGRSSNVTCTRVRSTVTSTRRGLVVIVGHVRECSSIDGPHIVATCFWVRIFSRFSLVASECAQAIPTHSVLRETRPGCSPSVIPLLVWPFESDQ